MRKILVLLALVLGAIPCIAQQYPPYIFLDANLNPYPSGSGSALGSNPPYALCYTNVTGQPLPCNFGGGTTGQALTMNNSGSGAASGTIFDGSVARTISTNTIGALNAANNLSDVANAATAVKNLNSAYIPAGCRLTTDFSATGNTTAQVAMACQFATGSLGANSVIKAHAVGTSNSGNSSDCTFAWSISATAAVGTGFAFQGSSGANTNVIMEGTVAMRNSVASQIYSGTGLLTNSLSQIAPGTTAIDNSSGPLYIVLTAQPGTSGDTCRIREGEVVVWPSS